MNFLYIKELRLKQLCILLSTILVLLSLFSNTVFAAAGINQQINFQGKVTNSTGTNVSNGSYTFVFGLYTASSGGVAVWTETKSLTVTDGVFQTNLGDTTALPGSIDFNTDNIYLGVEFNSDGEMTPRIRFTAAPYAFNALKVAGLTVTNTTGTFTLTNAKTLTVSDTTSIGTNSITFAGTEVLTLAATKNVTFADAFTTSGANPLTLTTTGSTNVTLPTTGTLATLAGTESLSNKTLVSPIITTSPTAAGATWTDLGTVTTADINGGTIDGSVIGGSSAAAGTFTALTANSSLTVGNGANFLAGQTTGKIGFGGAVSVSNYLMNITLDSTQDWVRGINITQTSNAHQSSEVISIVSTSNYGTFDAEEVDISNLYSSISPTISLTNGSTLSMITSSLASTISSVTLGVGANTINAYGESISVSSSATYNSASGADEIYAVGLRVDVTGNPTLTSVTAASTYNTYGGDFSNIVTNAGSANLAAAAYGIKSVSTGNLTTTGTTTHYGGYFDSAGTADNNYGIYLNSTADGTNNYGLYINTVASGAANYSIYNNAAAQSYLGSGNVGIGTTAPGQLFAVGTGGTSNFTVTSAGTTVANGLITGNLGLTISGGTASINTSGTSNTAIGNATGTFALTSNGGLNVTTGGVLTGVASVDTIAVSATAITFAGAGTISSTTSSAMTLDSGTTGALNIGTGANAKTITIGNVTGATALALNSGTGSQTFTSKVATGTTTTSGFVFDAGDITSGTGLYLTTDSVTTGKLLNIATTGNTWTGNSTTSGLIDIASTSTAGTASDADIMLKIARSGANSNTAHTAYGLYSTVTNTNATSGTNIAAYLSASGATTANYGLLVAAGSVGVGTVTPTSLVDVTTNSLGTTQTNTSGLALVNNTAAANGAQQISPALRWRGYGYSTDSGSMPIDFRASVVPVQGGILASGYLTFERDINGGGYANILTLSSAGNVGIGTTAPGAKLEITDGTDALRVSSVGDLTFVDANDGASITGPAGGTLTLTSNLATGQTTTEALRFTTVNDLGAADEVFQIGDNGTTNDFLTVLGSGNVGIGITSPVTLLEVLPSTTNSSIKTGGLELQSYAVNNNWIGDNSYFNGSAFKYRSNGYGGLVYFNSGNIDFYTMPSGTAGNTQTTTSRLTILNTGNVGIGITGPGFLLEVNGTSRVNGAFTIGDASGDTVTANAASWTFANDTNFVLSGGANGLSFDTSTFSVDATNDRIGVGNTAPGVRLDAGNSSGQNTIRVTGGSSANFAPVQSFFRTGVSEWTASIHNTTGEFSLGLNPASYTDANLATAAKFAINALGNVGIGTTAPARLFHVAGAARITTSTAVTDDRTLCTAAASGDIEFVNGACGTSSRRYKENIKDLGYGLDELMRLNPVFFNYTKDSGASSDLALIDNRTKRRIGFIAEEVNEVIPEVVQWQNGIIEGLDLSHFTALNTKAIQQLNTKVENLASTGITLKLDSNGQFILPQRAKAIVGEIDASGGQFIIKNSDGQTRFQIDESGNANLSGTLTVGRLIAGQIDGLEVIADKLMSLESRVRSQEDKESSNSAALDSLKAELDKRLATPEALLADLPDASSSGDVTYSNLFVAGVATVSGQLTADSMHIRNSAIIESVLNVVDTITSARLIVTDLAQFMKDVVFKGDVEFAGRPTFNQDTAGIVTVKKGEKSVEVHFEREYSDSPVITGTLTVDKLEKQDQESDTDFDNRQKELEEKILNGEYKFIIARRNKDGFVVKLNKAAEDDLQFSWTALAVKHQEVVSN